MPRVSESFSIAGKVDRSGKYPKVLGSLICGPESKWGYGYITEAFTPEVLAAYERVPSFLGHGKKGEVRDPATRLGWWEEIQKRADGMPEGTYCVNPKHPLAEAFLWAAENKPDLYKFSHVADVTFGTRDGKKVVTSIDFVEAIDVVSDGGTTSSIFENAPGRSTVATVKEYANKLSPRVGVKGNLKLFRVMEEYGDMPMNADAPPAESCDDGDGIKAAFKSAINGLLDDAESFGGKMSDKDVLSKIKTLMSSHGVASDKGSSGGSEEETEEAVTKKKAEEAALAAKIPATPATVDYATAHKECVAEGFAPSPIQIEAVMGFGDSKKRQAFICEQKGHAAATTPVSRGRGKVQESGPDKGKSSVEEATDAMLDVVASVRGLPRDKV